MPQTYPGRARVLVLLVISQFLCVSLWFAGNSVIRDLVAEFGLMPEVIGHLTTSVQLGFIGGTLVFAALAIADRFSPSGVFLVSALIAACCSAGMVISEGEMSMMYGSRFLTGFFLAGVYPVGMKIAADYYQHELGKALGYLVGALVLGTAFPHLLVYLQTGWDWRIVMLTTSLMSVAGGLLVYFFIPDGPYRTRHFNFKVGSFLKVFSQKEFRAIAFGYFGHMWELYAFWTFVPYVVGRTICTAALDEKCVALISFGVIAAGALGCVQGGYIARKVGSYRVAFRALLISGICCAVSPWILTLSIDWVVLLFLIFWGVVVILDSPQFSALVTQTVPDGYRGTALTAVLSLGFGVTVLSIQLVTWMIAFIRVEFIFLLLLPGPVLGVLAMKRM